MQSRTIRITHSCHRTVEPPQETPTEAQQKLGRRPTRQELAEAMGMKVGNGLNNF